MDKVTSLGSEGVYAAIIADLLLMLFCAFLISFVLFVFFISLAECFSLFSILNLVIRSYKRACTFPIARGRWEIYENLEKVSLNKTLVAAS